MSAIACILQAEGIVPPLDGGRMLDALRGYVHDAAGEWSGGPVWLGCAARHIAPESLRETLPFRDPESGLAVAADAMLDNRAELFGLLQVPAFRCGAVTDSELILLAYRKWGTEAPRYLVGDFAFLIWDPSRNRLFGARDAMGNRSLYYARQRGRVAFATVTAPLFALGGVGAELDRQWLAEYMAIPEMYESTDPFATCYRDIRQLPPSHTVTAEGGDVAFAPYTLAGGADELRLGSDAEYEEAFRDVFRQAVDARLRTHQQVAATLSGGLDSGSVAAFAAPSLEAQGKPLHTLSYIPVQSFRDWTPNRSVANETPYIRDTVSHVGNIRDRYLDFEGRSSYSVIEEWLDIMDAPYKFFENSFWFGGMFEQAGKLGAGVLLTGSKGNFGVSWGPAVPYYALLLRRLRLVKFAGEIHKYSRKKGIARTKLLSIVAKHAFPGLDRSHGEEPNMPTLLISPAFAEETRVFEKMREHGIGLTEPLFRDPLVFRLDRLSNPCIGNKNGAISTKLSLRYGVMERDPTADPRVIRFCLSVPFEQYVRDGVDRALIRRATAGWLPDRIRLNQRYRGVQGADWLYRMQPQWPAFLDELASLAADPLTGEFLNVGHIRRALDEYREPSPDMAFQAEIKVLMRALILYRFLKRAEAGRIAGLDAGRADQSSLQGSLAAAGAGR